MFILIDCPIWRNSGCEQHLVREELWFIHVNQRLGPYQDAIVISTTVCPVEDAITTAGESCPTGPSGNGKGHDSGNGNDCTISTILSTRTVTLTQYPATVTDCPARDQVIHITTETVVAGITNSTRCSAHIICSRADDDRCCWHRDKHLDCVFCYHFPRHPYYLRKSCW